MARRKHLELQEPLICEVLAVFQGLIASLLETQDILGQAEGGQPLHDVLARLWRLQHDAQVSPLPHQEELQKR